MLLGYTTVLACFSYHDDILNNSDQFPFTYAFYWESESIFIHTMKQHDVYR